MSTYKKLRSVNIRVKTNNKILKKVLKQKNIKYFGFMDIESKI